MSNPLAGFTVVDGLDAERVARPPSRTRKARPVSEASVKDRVLAKIALLGGYGIAKHMTSAGKRGTPDVLACLNGRMLVIEVKTVGNVPTPAQLGELRRWQEAGALACWVQEPAHLDHALEHLTDRDWRNNFEYPGDGRQSRDPW